VVWSALGRYDVDPAPAGLAFVQELIDTIAVSKPGREDLLADPTSARKWLDSALTAWADTTGAAPLSVDLTPQDLDRLRDFRDDLRRAVAPAHDGTTGAAAPIPVTLPTVALSMHWDEAGRVHPVPRGTGWKRVASLVAVEVFKAQQDGSWSRLKTCRNPRCAVAFFDRSRNNSGVWHNVKVCGNAANLRAYRARQRGPGTTA
jgi:predicted RNA-binding Zn ribbon-like protein